MRKYIYIACGAFAGAVLRYLIRGIELQSYHENVPLNTLFINVLGAFALAFVLTAALEIGTLDAELRLGLTTGFLGAFTTFSTLCKETVALLKNGDYFSAVSYVTVSTALGLAAAYFGIVLARELGAKLANKKEKAAAAEEESDVD